MTGSPAPPHPSAQTASKSAAENNVGIRGHALAAVAAAALIWVVVCGSYPFHPPESLNKQGGFPVAPTPEQAARMTRHRYENVTWLLAMHGAATAVFLAMATAFGCRSWRLAMVGLASGLLIGSVCGAVAGLIGQRFLDSSVPFRLGEPFGLAAVYALCWSVLGLGVGFAVSLPLADWRSIAVNCGGALFAALAAALAYPLLEAVAGVLWPASGLGELLPNGAANRLLWLATPSVFVGVSTALAHQCARARTRPASW